MSTGVIISTHGLASKEMLETTEMIVGEQSDVVTVSFLEGDSLDDLKLIYSEALKKLDECQNILILVDILGGSPFNVAAELSVEVITGVNIPMLIELFMSRQHLEFEELVDNIINTSIKSIKKVSNLNIDEDTEF